MPKDAHGHTRKEHEKLRLAFFEAAQHGHKADLDRLRLQGVGVNETDNNGATALVFAVSTGNLETVDTLIAGGANVNAPVGRGFIDEWDVFTEGATPLILACWRNFPAVADTLITHGANVNAKDVYGLTPLHYAAKRGNAELIEKLLAKGADINARDRSGHSAEYFARENGFKDLADALKARMRPDTPPKPPGLGR